MKVSEGQTYSMRLKACLKSLSRSACLSVCLSFRMSIYLPACAHVFARLYIVCPFINNFRCVCLCICLFVCLSVRMSISMSVCMSARLSLCLCASGWLVGRMPDWFVVWLIGFHLNLIAPIAQQWIALAIHLPNRLFAIAGLTRSLTAFPLWRKFRLIWPMLMPALMLRFRDRWTYCFDALLEVPLNDAINLSFRLISRLLPS